jgi:hypothetical protein
MPTQIEMLEAETSSPWKDVDYELPVKMDQEGHVQRQRKIVKDWLGRLSQLAHDDNPGEDMIAHYKAFTRFLIDHQRFDDIEDMKIKGSWCLPDDPHMPSDARVDFMYMPSYIAISWLSLIKQKIPTIAEEIANFESGLIAGLDFSAGRGLEGHGYERVQQLLEAVDILYTGKVFSMMTENPKLSLKFSRAMNKAKASIRKQLDENQGWGSIDEKMAADALLKLRGKPV